ncbi:hypothetical protein FRB99_005730 [Tulasnella sp. 403]|nr:hypothetical protein FRB99_005730 [Tulasnella sp. 403]
MSSSSNDERLQPTSANVPDLRHNEFFPEGTVDPIYQAKAELLNKAIEEIGFGRYQQFLFVVTGFGWMIDNMWPVVLSLILTPVVNEFRSKGPYLPLSQQVGILVGAMVFGLGCDIWGRKLSFNFTLLVLGIFATSAAGAPNFNALCVFIAIWSVGVGGNTSVGSAIFLEFLPPKHQFLLTVLSIWWSFVCLKHDNMGWRYFLIIGGVFMFFLWGIRFFVFKLYESPKYLMGKGRDAEAVEVVHRVAEYNGKTSTLSVEDLKKIGAPRNHADTEISSRGAQTREAKKLSLVHVKALFRTRELAQTTILIILVWACLGMAYPLYSAFIPYYSATRGADFGDGSTYITYRNLVIVGAAGIPGAAIGGWAVDIPRVGRKGALAISVVVTGIILCASTTAQTSNALLGWNCAFTLTSNVQSGIMYAMTPELFPTKDRGTGSSLAATAGGIGGVMAPLIALYADLSTSIPVWIAAALYLVAGILALLIPLEPQGKASL